MPTSSPKRGEVWLVAYEPVGQTVGREQAGRRPALVISVDGFVEQSGLVLAVPITSTRRPHPPPTHVLITPPDGGLQRESTLLCEQVRSISQSRLIRKLGTIPVGYLDAVVLRLRAIAEP